MTYLTEAQRAYLAGIMDGEGHFSIARYRRTGSGAADRPINLKVVSRITQSRRLLLDTIADWFEPGDTNVVKAGKDGAYFMLVFNHDCMRCFIPQVMPYLVLKKRQAEICMYFLSNARHLTGRKPIPQLEWQHRLELFEECRQLNVTPQKLARLADARTQNPAPVTPQKAVPAISTPLSH